MLAHLKIMNFLLLQNYPKLAWHQMLWCTHDPRLGPWFTFLPNAAPSFCLSLTPICNGLLKFGQPAQANIQKEVFVAQKESFHILKCQSLKFEILTGFCANSVLRTEVTILIPRKVASNQNNPSLRFVHDTSNHRNWTRASNIETRRQSRQIQWNTN